MTRMPASLAALVALTFACAALLALPGRTVTSAFVNDLMIFVDGANRIAFGQVPSRDFHTALGPVVFYLPALGYLLSGSFGGAMPYGMALFMLVLLPAMIWIFHSRLGWLPSLLLGGFLILLLAAPINIGSRPADLSFAMFYNRMDWVTLGLLLVMYLPPFEETRKGRYADSAVAAFLALVLIYSKLTYGLVALAFLLFLITDSRQRHMSLAALGITLAAVPLIEIFWRGTFAYAADLLQAASVSGGHDAGSYVRGTLRNFADLSIFLIFASVSLHRSRSLRDLAFYLFCAAAGLLILNQNAHGWGIITLHCGAAVAVETVRRDLVREGRSPVPGLAMSGLPLLLLFYLLPPSLNNASALVLHATLSLAQAGVPIGLPLLKDIRYVERNPSGQSFTGLYVRSMASGGAVLQDLPPEERERVMVLDFANPFSAGLGLSPPRGDSAWLHWGRNVSDKSYIPPDKLFADVGILMIPKIAINTGPLQDLYGDAVARNFTVERKTDQWTLMKRRTAGEGRSGP